MQGLSFREYLKLFKDVDFPIYTLNEILNHKVVFDSEFLPLVHFNEYLRQGYYPFALQDDYFMRIRQIINITLESDIPQYANMNVATGRKL